MLDEEKAMKAASNSSKRDITGNLEKVRGAWHSRTVDEGPTRETHPYEENFGDPELTVSTDDPFIAERDRLEDTEEDFWTFDGPVGMAEGDLLHPDH